METIHRIATILVIVAFGAMLVAPTIDRAAVASTPQAAIPLSTAYSQNFDSLAASGTGNPWNDDGTIAGWYSSRSSYNASTGSATAGALYSFGSSGSSERSLGSLATGTTSSLTYGARFVNDQATPISSITVSYWGEEWRNSGNTAHHQLDFSYQISNTVTSLTAGPWTDVNELDFVGPIAGGIASALNGNDPANRVGLTASFAVEVAPGQEIMLRWSDPDDLGSDHGLAIDDLAVTSTPLAVIIEEFSATPQADHILVAWRTSSEIDCAGFNLYRSGSPGAPQDLLGFVPSQAPGSAQGASYTWQDFDVSYGQTTYYWLEVISLAGTTHLHGPVSATYQGPTAVRVTTVKVGGPPWRTKTWPVIFLVAGLSALIGLVSRHLRHLT